MRGTHKETVFIAKDSTTLSGVIEHGKYPVLEDEGLHNDAVLYSGNAVMGQAGKNFIFRNNIIVVLVCMEFLHSQVRAESSRIILSPGWKTWLLMYRM